MKGLPLPFEQFRGKEVFDCGSASDSFSFLQQQQLPQKWTTIEEHCYVGSEPTSVLDITSNSSSPPASSSTLSSSHGSTGVGNGCCCGSTDSTIGVALTTTSDNPTSTTTVQTGRITIARTGAEKCGIGMEDWGSVLPESPGQDQSILRLIMGDIEDPSAGLSKLLQSGGDSGGGSGSQGVEFTAGFGFIDQAFVPVTEVPITSENWVGDINLCVATNCIDVPSNSQNANDNNTRFGSATNLNSMFTASASGMSPVSVPSNLFHHYQQGVDAVDGKPQMSSTYLMINQNQTQLTQNPAFLMPMTYAHLPEHQLLSQPPTKTLNPSTTGQSYQIPKVPFLDSGQELLLRRRQQQQQQQLQFLPHHLQQLPSVVVPPKQKMMNPGEDLATHLLQQAIIDQLFMSAELIDAGNQVLAHGILARLNHQLSPIGKPFQRAAFYLKEALELLLHTTTSNSLVFSPISLIFKIGAYKSFSEISPILQFANFTCNQALLESVEGFDRIHVIDFDIGFGGQWASFMRELALRNGGAPHLKITAFVFPSAHDEIELGFTQENLKEYATELKMSFELEIVRLESMNSGSWPQPRKDNEAIAVNMPIVSFLNYPSTLPQVLRFVRQLMPKIVVTLDRSCDRTDVSFPEHLMHVLQTYSALLESMDAVNVDLDIIQTIEKHFLQPAVEKIVLGSHRLQERTHPWMTLLLSFGFSPLTFSNFTESQAECLVQRTAVRGFHVEKKQSALVLCWQRKDLISVSAWRC